MASKRTVNKLSDSVIRAAESQEKTYCLSDGGNLFLEITKAGTKSWRYNYRFNGKSKTCRFGKYPLVGLADAREWRRLAIDQIANGKDPALVKKLEKNTLEADTFEEVACDWMDTNQVNWSPSHATRTASYLKRDVYPIIGQMGLKAIEVKHIILIIRNVAGCGAVDAARRLKGVIAQVFDYGVVNQLCDVNPASQFQLKALNLPDVLTNTNPIKGSKPRSKSVDIFLVLTS